MMSQQRPAPTNSARGELITRCAAAFRRWRAVGFLFALAAGCDRPPPAVDGELPLAFPHLEDMVVLLEGGAGAPLLIDRFEVTDGEFHEFLTERREAGDPYQPADSQGYLSHWPVAGDGLRAPRFSERDMPVRSVSLRDARAFAAHRGKSIPNRVEWLRATPGLRLISPTSPSGGSSEEKRVEEMSQFEERRIAAERSTLYKPNLEATRDAATRVERKRCAEIVRAWSIEGKTYDTQELIDRIEAPE